MQPKVTIKIPNELYEKLSQVTSGTGFPSVTQFIIFVMRTVILENEAQKGPVQNNIKAVRERLNNVGYLK